ncbi:MAG: protein kinase [bacterium]|nr:protein kinase [bacterium]
MSTNNGLTQFNPQTGKFVNFDFRDGLQHNEFNSGAYCKCRGGQMCFGGLRGFNIFLPEDVTLNPFPPPVVIDSFRVVNREMKWDKPIYELNELRVAYKDFPFSFEFAALDYRAPEKNRYAYKMEGVNKEWITTGSRNRVASYSKLSPGTYVFRVKASNNSGLWNEKGKSIRVVIVPPFWKTWWFRSIAVIFFSFLSYIIINFSRRYFTLISFWKTKNLIGSYKVIERGEHHGRLFIAMEYLKGQSLGERLRNEREVPVDEGVEIMVQLLDFGLVKSEGLTQLTESGMLIGTITYLAPERFAGSDLSFASDVYALGVIFYEMLTGERPFIGETTVDILKQILNKEPIEPRKFTPEISHDLNLLIMRMLSKDPDDRPETEEVLDILEDMLE